MFSLLVWFFVVLFCSVPAHSVNPSKKSKSFRSNVPPDNDYADKTLPDWENLPLQTLQLISNAHNLPSTRSAHRLAVSLFNFYNPAPPVVDFPLVDSLVPVLTTYAASSSVPFPLVSEIVIPPHPSSAVLPSNSSAAVVSYTQDLPYSVPLPFVPVARVAVVSVATHLGGSGPRSSAVENPRHHPYRRRSCVPDSSSVSATVAVSTVSLASSSSPASGTQESINVLLLNQLQLLSQSVTRLSQRLDDESRHVSVVPPPLPPPSVSVPAPVLPSVPQFSLGSRSSQLISGSDLQLPPLHAHDFDHSVPVSSLAVPSVCWAPTASHSLYVPPVCPSAGFPPDFRSLLPPSVPVSVPSFPSSALAIQSRFPALPVVPVQPSSSSVASYLPQSHSLPPLPHGILQQIRAGEYFVNFDVIYAHCTPMQPRSSSVPTFSFSLATGADGSPVVDVVPNRGGRPRVSTITSWITAFSLFMQAMACFRPHLLLPLVGYQQLIVTFAGSYGAPDWLAYDLAFREHVTANPSVPWDVVDERLFTAHLRSAAHVSRCFSCGGSGHFAAACPVARAGSGSSSLPAVSARPPFRAPQRDAQSAQPACFQFQRRGRCDRPNCRYFHPACPRCGGSHSGAACPPR